MWSNCGGEKKSSFLWAEYEIYVGIPKSVPLSGEKSLGIFCPVVAGLWDLGCELKLWNLSLFISYDSGISVVRAVPLAQSVHSEFCWHDPRGTCTRWDDGLPGDSIKSQNQVTDPAFRIKYWAVCYSSFSGGNFKLKIPPESAAAVSGPVYTSEWAEWTGWTKPKVFYITPATGELCLDNIIEHKQQKCFIAELVV